MDDWSNQHFFHAHYDFCSMWTISFILKFTLALEAQAHKWNASEKGQWLFEREKKLK